MATITNVEDYLGQFDGEIRHRLDVMRECVRVEVPNSVESLSYGLVGYKLNGKPLVYFGGFRNHIGFYATPNGHEAFIKEFESYEQGKGSVRFPLDRELPIDLVRRVVRFRKEQCADDEVQQDDLPHIGLPATNALHSIGITKTSQLSEYSERDLLRLHGFGPKAISILKEANVILKKE